MAGKLYSQYRFDDVNVVRAFTLSELSQLFIFHFLSAAGQVADSMWLNGHNPAGRRKQGTFFPGKNGDRGALLIQATEYKART